MLIVNSLQTDKESYLIRVCHPPFPTTFALKDRPDFPRDREQPPIVKSGCDERQPNWQAIISLEAWDIYHRLMQHLANN